MKINLIRIIFISFFIIYLYDPSYTQITISNDKEELKKGFYFSFHEFQSNNPSIKFEYEIVTHKNRKNYSEFTINISKSQSKQLGKGLFGFCDGNYVYLNSNRNYDSFIDSKTVFYKLQSLGRYCYYEYLNSRQTHNFTTGGTNFHNEICQAVLDITDGKTHNLFDITIKSIYNHEYGSGDILMSNLLKQHEELYNSYKLEEDKNDKFQFYIEAYSNLNYSVIDEYNSLIINNIDSLIYVNDSDSTMESYYNRVLSYVSDPRILEIKTVKSYNITNGLIPRGLMSKHSFRAQHKTPADENYWYKVGTWIEYHSNGIIKKKVNYDFRGRKHGNYIQYDREGNIKKKEIFQHGQLIHTNL